MWSAHRKFPSLGIWGYFWLISTMNLLKTWYTDSVQECLISWEKFFSLRANCYSSTIKLTLLLICSSSPLAIGSGAQPMKHGVLSTLSCSHFRPLHLICWRCPRPLRSWTPLKNNLSIFPNYNASVEVSPSSWRNAQRKKVTIKCVSARRNRK